MRFLSTLASLATMALLCSLTAAQDDSWSSENIPSVPQSLKITNLLRTLDLSRPLIREITSAAILNTGQEDATVYYHPVDQVYTTHLAHISAENRKTKEALEVIKDTEFFDADFRYYKIKLQAPLPPGEKMQITVKASFSNLAYPFPTHVGQAERQQLMYFGNSFALTAYPASKQKTTVITPNSVLEVHEHPEESEPVIKNNQVILGPYNDVKPLEHGVFEVQYQLLGPVPHVRHLRRDVEVSQWGDNLAVEEHYNFVNRGAELKGHFSRVDYQRNPMGIREGNGILALQTQVPKTAQDIYYRDEIGNISTSILTQQPNHILFTLQPRFPIFGGWNTTFYLGYNTPLSQYLRRIPGTDRVVLKVPFYVPMKDTSYDDVEIRIVLPEGAKNVNVQVPFEVESVEKSTTKTYMDSAGRSTVTIHARNLIEEHAQDLLIEYELTVSSYLIKPLAAATMLMAIFVSSMVLSRVDFKIGGSALNK